MMISDLPDDLIEEILARIPATSIKRIKTTCKQWNTLFNDHRFTKKHFDKSPREFLVLILKNFTVHSVNVNLSGIHNNIDPSIEVKGKFGKLSYDGLFALIKDIFHCDGLLLCTTLTIDGDSLMVYNPIMGQTRWIKPRTVYESFDMYALGYKNNKSCCDNYKILRCSWGRYDNLVEDAEFEIYEFKSNTWKVLDDMSPHLEYTMREFGVSLKGNTYWPPTSYKEESVHGLLIRFDFTRERFQHLRLPFTPRRHRDIVVLSTVREEQLVVLYQKKNTLEIWVTNKIDETKNVSWSMFFTVDSNLYKLLLRHFMSFMVDEENKVVMCCGVDRFDRQSTRFYIVGEYEFRQVDHHLLGDYPNQAISWKLLSYVPCLVQIL